MSQLLSLATDCPECSVSAPEMKELIASMLPGAGAAQFQSLIDTARIRERHTAAPLSELRRLGTLCGRNAVYERAAVPLAERVAVRALGRAGIQPSGIDVVIATSSTGHMIPTLDQHLANRLGLRPNVRCVSMTNLGCAGAIRAIGLAADLLCACGRSASALVISVELCSLWLQVSEPSPEDLFGNMLFGDGAGAVVVGRWGPAGVPEIIATRSELWPNSLDARGARLTTTGLRHFCSPALPRLVRTNLRRTVSNFLSSHGVTARDLRFCAINPSDHRLLKAAGSILELSENTLRPSWEVWEHQGNTLSAGPLFVIQALEATAPPADGDLGLVLVLGPGISCDLLLLRWHGRLRVV